MIIANLDLVPIPTVVNAAVPKIFYLPAFPDPATSLTTTADTTADTIMAGWIGAETAITTKEELVTPTEIVLDLKNVVTNTEVVDAPILTIITVKN